MNESSMGAEKNIDKLVEQLSSQEMLERIEAREALVGIGPTVIPAVSNLADSPDPHVRWECAKALANIADVSSIDTLIKLLEDSEEGTRWDAALGLIAIGKPAVTPVLRAVISRSVGYTIISGARHVMHELSQTNWGGVLRPVYKALNSSQASVSGPVAASKALEEWEYGDLSHATGK